MLGFSIWKSTAARLNRAQTSSALALALARPVPLARLLHCIAVALSDSGSYTEWLVLLPGTPSPFLLLAWVELIHP